MKQEVYWQQEHKNISNQVLGCSMIKQPTNSNILHPKPPKNSFVVGKWDDAENFYAVLPIGNALAVVHQCAIIKKCRNAQSARNFISKHQKRRK